MYIIIMYMNKYIYDLIINKRCTLFVLVEKVSVWDGVLDSSWRLRRKRKDAKNDDEVVKQGTKGKKKNKDEANTKGDIKEGDEEEISAEKWTAMDGPGKFDILLRIWLRSKKQRARRQLNMSDDGASSRIKRKNVQKMSTTADKQIISTTSAADNTMSLPTVIMVEEVTTEEVNMLQQDLGEAYTEFHANLVE